MLEKYIKQPDPLSYEPTNSLTRFFASVSTKQVQEDKAVETLHEASEVFPSDTSLSLTLSFKR